MLRRKPQFDPLTDRPLHCNYSSIFTPNEALVRPKILLPLAFTGVSCRKLLFGVVATLTRSRLLKQLAKACRFRRRFSC